MNIGACIALSLVAAASAAHAAPQLLTANYARFYSATDPRATYACWNLDGVDCNGSAPAPGTNWTVNYFSSGSAAFGVLRDYARVTLTGDGSLGRFPSFASIGARSGYQDSLVISGGIGSGTINFEFEVSGTASRSGGAVAGPLLQFVPLINGVDFGGAINHGVVNGHGSVPVDFEFDQPVEFIIYFYALAQVFGWVPDSFAEADFSHTAVLSHISVFDSDGAPVPYFAIASESGTHYTANGVLALPSALSLAMAACLALLITLGPRDRGRGTTRRTWPMSPLAGQ